MSSLQKKLHSLSLESGSLDSEITQRKELLHKIESEDRIVTKVRIYTRSVLVIYTTVYSLVITTGKEQS